MAKQIAPKNGKWTLAYAIDNNHKDEDGRYTTDSYGALQNTGSIYLMNPNGHQKEEDICIAKRANIVSAMCFIPNYGLFDTGRYGGRIEVRDGGPGAWGDLDTEVRRYADSELRKLINIGGSIVDQQIQGRDGETTPSISSLLYVPGIGLLGRKYGYVGLYLFLDKDGEFVNKYLYDTRFDNSCQEYVPEAGIFSGGSSLEHTVNTNGKLLRRKLLNNCPDIFSLCFHPSLGLISSSKWNGVRLETDSNGNKLRTPKKIGIRNYPLNRGYVDRFQYSGFVFVPGTGVMRFRNMMSDYFSNNEDSIDLVIDDEGKIFSDDREHRKSAIKPKEIRKRINVVTAVAPIPLSFFEIVKKHFKS